MPIVATAGHVDHGKSTLVQALTGRDPDRWQEEKDRGLTIDLGFAWADLGSGEPVGFVDVPGHERFIKNMLAGVGAVDVALFVVAADEGWMPQSEEHAAVLDVLGVSHGVIALSRADLVDEETLELAHLDVVEHTEGTGLEHWPVVAVSAGTGDGIDQLRSALVAALAEAGPPRDVGRPRLWVDRSFTIAGAGLVITGTLVDGTIRQGDELDLWPGPHRVRVRAIQRHEAATATAPPGARTALNISGVDREAVPRGAVLTVPDALRATTRILADLRTVRSLSEPLTDRGAYQLHLGSGAWPVRLRLLVGSDLAGVGPALLQLDHAAPLAAGDRFVLRETGRRAVVAGGRVLDPSPPTSRAALVAAANTIRDAISGTADDVATALLEVRRMARLDALAADSGGGRPRTGIVTETEAVAESAVPELAAAVSDAVAGYHAQHPLRPGMPRAAVATTVGVEPALLGALIAGDAGLVDDGATIRSATFSGGAIDGTVWAGARAALESAGFAAPRASTLGLDREVVHALVRSGEVVRVAADLLYLPEHIGQIVKRLGDLPQEFTVADFRDAFAMSRRQAVPLLEWLDRSGFTRRRGDVRSVRAEGE